MGGTDLDESITNHVSGQANKPLSRPPHALTIEQVVEELKANPEDGLTDGDAKTRLEEYGKNQFGEEKGVQPIKILVAQVANAMTLVSFPLYLSARRHQLGVPATVD